MAYGQTVSPYFIRNLYLSRLFSTVMNAGWLLKDLEMLSETYQPQQISDNKNARLYLTNLVVSIFLHVAGTRLYTKADPLASLSDRKKSLEVTLDHTPEIWHSLDQVLVLSRTLTNLMMACLAPEYRLWAIFNTVALSYSYWKNAQIKWMKLSWKKEIPAIPLHAHDSAISLKAVQFDYKFPLFPNQNQNTPCVICLETNPPFDFCPPHAPFHLDCLAKNLSSNIEVCAESITSSPTQIDSPPFNQLAYPIYQAIIQISDASFPSCPVCKTHSDNPTLEAQCFTQDDSKCHVQTTIEWIRDSDIPAFKFARFDSLWARLGAIYSIFQAGLAIMHQRHHDIAGKIASLKEILILCNMGTIAHHYWQLYTLLYEKYVVTQAQNDTPQERVKKAATALGTEKLAHYNLNEAINSAISEGKILEIWDKRAIPLSQAGKAVIEKLKNAIENKDILGQDTLKAQTVAGSEVIQEFITALTNGEIISVNRFIPLSLESVAIIQQLVKYLAKKEIIVKESQPGTNGVTLIVQSQSAQDVILGFKNAIIQHKVAMIMKNCLPLSSDGLLKMERYREALSKGTISPDGNGNTQFLNQDSETIYREFLESFDNFEILSLDSTQQRIPLTPQAKGLLKQLLACENRLNKAYNENEEAEQEAQDARSALQKKYHNNLQLALVVGGAVLTAGSALIVHLFNKRLYSAINLTQVLKKVALSDDLKNREIRLEVGVHWMPYLSQCVVAHRIFLDLVLTVFLPNKYTYALSAGMQGITLWKSPLP